MERCTPVPAIFKRQGGVTTVVHAANFYVPVVFYTSMYIAVGWGRGAGAKGEKTQGYIDIPMIVCT